MIKNKLVSVIVPVYNVEGYLIKALNSLINQTYQNTQIILIDDGSTDKSGELCDIYARYDKRIKVIHQVNQGVSRARSVGLNIAMGKYIYFMDADDYIEPEMLADMVAAQEAYNVDLVNTGYIKEVYIPNQETSIILKENIFVPKKHYENKDEINKDLIMLWKRPILFNIWNKMYLTSIIEKNGLTFPDRSLGEDVFFNQEYLSLTNSMYNLDKCYYHYTRAEENTLSSKYRPDLFDLILRSTLEFIIYFEKNRIPVDEYETYIAERFIYRSITAIRGLYHESSPLSIIEKYNEIKKILTTPEIQTSLNLIKVDSRIIKMWLYPYHIKSSKLASMISLLMHELLFALKDVSPDLYDQFRNQKRIKEESKSK